MSSTGSIPSPLRSRAPCRRATRRSLSRNTTWRLWLLAGVKNESSWPFARSTWMRRRIAPPPRLLVQDQRRRRLAHRAECCAPGRTGRLRAASTPRLRAQRHRSRQGRRRTKLQDDRYCRRRRTSRTPPRRAPASRPRTEERRRPSRTGADSRGGSRRTEAQIDPRRGGRRPSAARKSVANPAAPSRQPCATQGCAPPCDRFCRLIRTWFMTGMPCDESDRDTGLRRPRCPSGSPVRRGRDPE